MSGQRGADAEVAAFAEAGRAPQIPGRRRAKATQAERDDPPQHMIPQHISSDDSGVISQ